MDMRAHCRPHTPATRGSTQLRRLRKGGSEFLKPITVLKENHDKGENFFFHLFYL